MGRTHYRPNEKSCEESVGTSGQRPEEKFLTTIVEVIIDKLKVSWMDKRIVEGLLKSSIEKDCKQLLEDFLHLELEILARSIAKVLSVESVVNYNYATHAKFNTMIEGYNALKKEE